MPLPSEPRLMSLIDVPQYDRYQLTWSGDDGKVIAWFLSDPVIDYIIQERERVLRAREAPIV